MSFELPKLQLEFSALEPHIDAQTMEIHYTKHHQTYVNNLNSALENHADLQKMALEELVANLDKVPEDIRTKVRNNGGGHLNHSLFWTLLSPSEGSEPTGKLSDDITSTFESLENFKELYSKAGLDRFGSGWVWLVLDSAGKLKITSTPNQDSPVMNGEKPILGLDVWEHAYYLKYQNRRADYIKAWWNVVNWSKANELYSNA